MKTNIRNSVRASEKLKGCTAIMLLRALCLISGDIHLSLYSWDWLMSRCIQKSNWAHLSSFCTQIKWLLCISAHQLITEAQIKPQKITAEGDTRNYLKPLSLIFSQETEAQRILVTSQSFCSQWIGSKSQVSCLILYCFSSYTSQGTASSGASFAQNPDSNILGTLGHFSSLWQPTHF